MSRSLRSAWIYPIAALVLMGCGGGGDTSGEMEGDEAQTEMGGDQMGGDQMGGDEMGGDEMGGMPHDSAGMAAPEGEQAPAGEGM